MMASMSLPVGGVVGVLGDGDDPDALAPEHGLEGDGVLALAGEPGELPDQNLPKRSVGLGSLVDHLSELGAVGDATALGLVHVLAGDDVAVLLGVVPERPELGGDGEVHVLAVAGDPGIERCGGVVGLIIHGCVLLAHSWSFRRASARWRRSCRSHSRSSMYRRMASRRNSAHGAAILVDHLLHLVRHLRGHGEADDLRLSGSGHSLFRLPVYYNFILLS